jgi:hypothetical protein
MTPTQKADTTISEERLRMLIESSTWSEAYAVGEEIRNALSRRSQGNDAAGDVRPCTCHPNDNPPVPCPRKYALSECRLAKALARLSAPTASQDVQAQGDVYEQLEYLRGEYPTTIEQARDLCNRTLICADRIKALLQRQPSEPKAEACETCGGDGWVFDGRDTQFRTSECFPKCQDCNGTGKKRTDAQKGER